MQLVSVKADNDQHGNAWVKDFLVKLVKSICVVFVSFIIVVVTGENGVLIEWKMFFA